MAGHGRNLDVVLSWERERLSCAAEQFINVTNGRAGPGWQARRTRCR